MTTKAKSNEVISFTLAQRENGTALLTFAVKDGGNVVLDTAKLSLAVIQRAAWHGLKQRVSDRAAISRNTDTGKPASPKDKLDAMRALVDHYHSGTNEWSMKREGGAGQSADSLLCEAMAQVYPGKTEAEIKEWVKGKSTKDKVALLNHGEIKVAADTIRAKVVEEFKVDVDAMLEGF